MSVRKEAAFRGLKLDFKNDLLEGKLRPILDFEGSHRDSFLVEIRNNYLDLYFLGHAIKVEQKSSDYSLSSADVFLPDKFRKWPISLNEIKKNYELGFKGFMLDIMRKIVSHKEGNISEGVSEMNHYIDNRIAYNPGDVVVIDRQVTHGRARIDLLGLKKLNNEKLSFVVIELKNKENKDIEEVFSQTKEYIDILWEHYDEFRLTYKQILEQKIELGLLDRKNKKEITGKPLVKEEIEGIVVLDNYNLRSARLKSALENDWAKIGNAYNIKLFLKTNTFNYNFLWNYEEARRQKIWNL